MLMVSITYYTNPFKNIWTYANGISSDTTQLIFCPCNTGNTATVIPSFAEMLVTYVNQDFLLENNGNKNYTHYGMENNVIETMDHDVLTLHC